MGIKSASFGLVLATASLLGLTADAMAEQKQQLGNWDVHYMAINSTFFDPQVTRAYGLQRSKYSAIINVAVLASDTQQAQSVVVKGAAKSLLSDEKALKFKEVVEGDAIYYLAQMSFRNQVSYDFDIRISRGNQVERLTFSQKFYTD